MTLAPDEVEILATPRPGTAVAGDEGLVVVIDTELTPELVAEGDARELQRAIQDLRKDAGLELDERIEVWLDADSASLDRLEPHMTGVAQEVQADRILRDAVPGGQGPAEAGLRSGHLDLSVGRVNVGIVRSGARREGG